MTRRTQKKQEQQFVEQLLACLDLEVRDLQPCDPAPDILLEWTGGRAGIEVTQIFQAPDDGELPAQVVESAEQRMQRIAEARWIEEGLPHVQVDVLFNPGHAVHPDRAEELGYRLYSLTRENLPETNGTHWVQWTWEQRNRIPAEFHSVTILRYASLQSTHFGGGVGGRVPRLTSEILQAAATRKEVADYSLLTAESWLLIVMDSRRFSGMFDMYSGLQDFECLEVSFDRAFLLDSLLGRAWELPICPPERDTG